MLPQQYKIIIYMLIQTFNWQVSVLQFPEPFKDPQNHNNFVNLVCAFIFNF